jgi:uncharacterized Zn-finger protein
MFSTKKNKSSLSSNQYPKKTTITNTNNSTATITTKNILQCSLCGKIFKIKSQLLDHIRVHTGERPFSCHTCKSAFKTKCDLKRHERIHDRVIFLTLFLPF